MDLIEYTNGLTAKVFVDILLDYLERKEELPVLLR